MKLSLRLNLLAAVQNHQPSREENVLDHENEFTLGKHKMKVNTEEYAVWSACEHLGIRPPGVKESWDACDVRTQAMILAYQQIRDYEGRKRA